jgi:two-component system, NtrC family, sensor kinase
VAARWRIRHKLMLGLGLVGGALALVLAGALQGLLSYYASMKSIDSKLGELTAADHLQFTLVELSPPDPRQPGAVEQFRQRTRAVHLALEQYQDRLQDTLNRGRDPDMGTMELQLIAALEERFEALDRSIQKPLLDQAAPLASSESIVDKYRTDAKACIKALAGAAGELRAAIIANLYKNISDSKGPYRLSVWLISCTSGVGAVLMVSLLRYFYPWVFYPIRDLQRGVERVAQGDFEHRIELHSGDEIEELAKAFNDMTDRLRVMYRDLEHQVNERSRQLVRSERLASVGFLAAGVAHEINNPLASIAFCSEALESRMADVLTRAPAEGEIVAKYLKMIQQEAFRCKEITQRLLEFSRGSERRREPTNLAELIQSVLDMVQHLQTSKGKQVVFRPAGAVTAWINAQEVKSVVLNLVVNALDSMEEDGILTITLGQRDRMTEMVFADTGCGMPPEVLENIFEPFFTRSRTGKGTGLGLSISHRVISQHGGEIEAASAGPDQGSTFTVRLPLQPAEEQRGTAVGRAGENTDREVGAAEEWTGRSGRMAA